MRSAVAGDAPLRSGPSPALRLRAAVAFGEGASLALYPPPGRKSAGTVVTKIAETIFPPTNPAHVPASHPAGAFVHAPCVLRGHRQPRSVHANLFVPALFPPSADRAAHPRRVVPTRSGRHSGVSRTARWPRSSINPHTLFPPYGPTKQPIAKYPAKLPQAPLLNTNNLAKAHKHLSQPIPIWRWKT